MRTSVQWWDDPTICVLHQNIAHPLSNNKEDINKADKQEEERKKIAQFLS